MVKFVFDKFVSPIDETNFTEAYLLKQQRNKAHMEFFFKGTFEKFHKSPFDFDITGLKGSIKQMVNRFSMSSGLKGGVEKQKN